MEAVGFIFETEQKPHFQAKRDEELKFIHPELNERLSQNGKINRARKYYVKPITDDEKSEIGLTTGLSSSLSTFQEMPPPNAIDTHGSTPAWVNRPNDNSLDKLLESIDRLIGNDKVGTLSIYYKNFEQQVKRANADNSGARRARLKEASKIPEKMSVWTTVYKRNPDVVVEVLERANGICEECGNKAPFLRKSDQSAYLEVHHVVPLSAGGDDTVENAIGLCPNCHRKSHFG